MRQVNIFTTILSHSLLLSSLRFKKLFHFLLIILGLTNRKWKEGDVPCSFFSKSRVLHQWVRMGGMDEKLERPSSLQNHTSKQPGEGDPQSHALVLLNIISMQPALFKTAQGSVCQRVIYDVSLVLLTGIFHFGSLSTFSSSSTKASLCPPLITTFRPTQSPPGQFHLRAFLTGLSWTLQLLVVMGTFSV